MKTKIKGLFKGDPKEAKQMCLGLGFIFAIWSVVRFFQDRPEASERFALVSVLILGIGIFVPVIVLPFARLLRFLVFALGWFNTYLMLGLVFYLIFTPTAFLLRLFGKKLMETDFRTDASSYWKEREITEYKPERDELQF